MFEELGEKQGENFHNGNKYYSEGERTGVETLYSWDISLEIFKNCKSW